jgi:hypothetical protein
MKTERTIFENKLIWRKSEPTEHKKRKETGSGDVNSVEETWDEFQLWASVMIVTDLWIL